MLLKDTLHMSHDQNALLLFLFQFESETSSAHWLRLPDEIKFQVDDALIQLESSYFQVHRPNQTIFDK